MAEITQIDLGLVVGDTGATGATGPTGPQGPGATISVGSVTTTTYGNPAQVTNSGTATDAVLDFVIPQGAPGEEVTDVSSLTLNSITETAASFPVPAVGDVMSVVMGKVKKFFADTVAALNTKLNKSNVVNDLTYTTEGYALDARAGKTLKTQIDSLNDSITKLVIDKTFISEVTVQANGTLEKTRDELGFERLSGYKLITMIPIVYGAGATFVIPFLSGPNFQYVAFRNVSAAERTVNTQLRCVYVKE